MRLLLLSNSTNYGDSFLQWPEVYIKQFLGINKLKIAFIPYAAVTFSFDDYEEIVKTRFAEMNYDVFSIHRENGKQILADAGVIAVGGGNTFNLLKLLQDNELLSLIKEKVSIGTPYIGWSAGSNIACPSICTTNDMPIVQPRNFDALNFLPFQINPHFTNLSLSGHGGETREQRIREYLHTNPQKTVVGLPEGSLLNFENGTLVLKGENSAFIFNRNEQLREIKCNSSLNFLLG
jgi:dipeptidase E